VGIDLMPLYYEGLYGEEYPGHDQADAAQRNQMVWLEELLGQIEGARDISTVAREIDQMATSPPQYNLSNQGRLDWAGREIQRNVQELLSADQLTAPQLALLSAMNYLTTTNAQLKDISGASGFGDSRSLLDGYGSQRMPMAFTQVIDKNM